MLKFVDEYYLYCSWANIFQNTWPASLGENDLKNKSAHLKINIKNIFMNTSADNISIYYILYNILYNMIKYH